MSLRGKAREFDCGNSERVFRFDEVDAEICGKVTDFKLSVTTKFGEYPVVKIIDEELEEEFTVFASPVILKRKLESLKPQPGDEIDVIFVGVLEKNNVKDFRVHLERDGEPVTVGASENTGAATTDNIPW